MKGRRRYRWRGRGTSKAVERRENAGCGERMRWRETSNVLERGENVR